MKRKLQALAIMLFTFVNTNAITFNENLLFAVTMSGDQLVPGITTNAHGVGSLMLNKTRDSISLNLTINELNSSLTSVKLNIGSTGVNGTTLLDLTSLLNGNHISTLLTSTLVTSNIENLLNENLYIIASTAGNPNGEIRGQVKLVSDELFETDLSGLNAVPSVTGNAYGLGSFRLSLDHSKLDYRVICQDLSGAITYATLNSGGPGTVGLIEEDITSSVNGNVIVGSLNTTPTLLTALLAGNLYLNISTTLNPTGEIRSQLNGHKGLVFDAWATGSQLIPALNNNAKGICIIRLSPTMDTLYYDAVVDNISSPIDYSHLHVGDYGMPYAALQVDFTSAIVGHRIKGIKTGAAVSNITKRKLLISNLSLVVHTTNYPNGEVRGQIVRFAHEGYTMNIDGAQVVSPVITPARGTGIVSINRDEDAAYYLWAVDGLTSVATGASFNNNIVGQNGPIINDITLNSDFTNSAAFSSGFWKSTDVVPFLIANSNQFSSESVYLQIVNANYPNGEVRGQVKKGFVNYSITSIDSEQAEFSEINIYPVPVKDVLKIDVNGTYSNEITLNLVDVLGRLHFNAILHPVNNSFNTTVDISKLQSGVYYVVLKSENSTIAKKIIKE